VLLCGVANPVFAQSPTGLPESLIPPGAQRLVLQAHAVGHQIYTCQPSSGAASRFEWVLSGPDAVLTDDAGKQIGRHFAGPIWQASDGSQVKGKMLGQVVRDQASVPWLLLAVVERAGSGTLSDVTFVQRLNTKGGRAPARGCDGHHLGDSAPIEYSADYYFYAPELPRP